MGVFPGKAEDIEDNRKKVSSLYDVESPQDELDKYPSVYAIRTGVLNPFYKELEDRDTRLEKIETDLTQHIVPSVDMANEAIPRLFEQKLDVAEANQIFANAIKGKESGYAVALRDISPIEHNVKVKLKNKNLAVYPYDGSYESHGITWTDDGDGTVHAVGTSTGCSQFWLTTTSPFEDGKTYTWTTHSPIELVLLYTNAAGVAKTAHGSITWSNRYTFERLYLQVAPNNIIDAYASPTINEGTVYDDWGPYISDFSTTKLKVFGKNILPPLIRDEYSAYGMTFTFREDGKVVLNGTSTSNITVKYPSASICLHPGITYTIGIDNPDWSFGNSSFFVSYIDGSGTTQRFRADDENRATFTWDESYSEFNIFIQVAPDKTFNNVVIAPQIEVGTAQTGYEPYKMTEYSPNADGTVEGVVSISPNMTLCSSDGLGVIVEAEYSKDTNKVVEKLMQAIISLGGNV